MKPYEHVDHTADLGIRVFGGDLNELFSNAAYGLFDSLIDLKKFSITSKEKIKISAENCEELLINFLRELLFKYIFEKKIIMKAEIMDLKNNFLEVLIHCANFEDKADFLKHDIKAVTYHNVSIQKKNNLYQTEIIFDV